MWSSPVNSSTFESQASRAQHHLHYCPWKAKSTHRSSLRLSWREIKSRVLLIIKKLNWQNWKARGPGYPYFKMGTSGKVSVEKWDLINKMTIVNLTESFLKNLYVSMYLPLCLNIYWLALVTCSNHNIFGYKEKQMGGKINMGLLSREK